MSLTVLAIAFAFTIPILIVAVVADERATVGYTAFWMWIASILTGSPQYMLIDTIAIVIVGFLSFHLHRVVATDPETLSGRSSARRKRTGIDTQNRSFADISLKERVNFAEAQKKYSGIWEWQELMSHYQKGDELWTYSRPYQGGVALVREGEVIFVVVTFRGTPMM